jgi:glycosyltransferase involved in cell wall biosynthesis
MARAHIAALGRLNHVVVGSVYMREYLIGEGISPELISVVDLGRFGSDDNSTLKVEPDPDRYRLLFVGRIVYNKGLQYLLRALAQLDSSYELDVVGEGWFLETAKQLVHRLGVGDRTDFLGELVGDDLAQRYRKADLVVVPSIWPEPVGLVVGEARRHGVSVIVSAAGGLPEWARGDSGVIVAPRADADRLASVIRRTRTDSGTVTVALHRHQRGSLNEMIVNIVGGSEKI